MLRTWPYLALLLLPLALGKARIQSRDDGYDSDGNIPSTKYRRRGMQRVLTLGDYIYINGGEISAYVSQIQDDDATSDSYSLTSTMVIPHAESWDISTLDFQYIDDSPLAINSAAFWKDSKSDRLYRWGGSLSRSANISEDDVVLHEFKPDNKGKGTWETADPANADTFQDIRATTGGGYTSCDQKGFWIGGVGRGSTDARLADVNNSMPLPIPGILTYDMATRKWSNDSTAPLNSPYGSIVNSAAACAQGFPLDPVVLSIGGQSTPPDNVYADEDELGYLDMKNLTFWDPASKRWLSQVTTGEIPSGRDSPCVAGARSTDGTYEIFMYGGHTDYGTKGDMYILSLPGFHWFNVDQNAPSRIDHACTVVGKRQMLSTGGVTKEWDWKSDDEWIQALGIFDMTDLKWKDSFDAWADDYESPKMVKDWYKDGGLDSVKWSSDEVKDMFVSKNGDNPGSDDSSSDSKSSSSNTGAIVGGVVGGVAGIGIIGALAWFILRRQRSNEAQKAMELDSTDATPKYELAVGGGSGAGTSPSMYQSNLTSSPATTNPAYPPVEMPVVGHERHELHDGLP